MSPEMEAFFGFAWKAVLVLVFGLWLAGRLIDWHFRRRETRILDLIGGGGVRIQLDGPAPRHHECQGEDDPSWEGGGVRWAGGRHSGTLHDLKKVRGGRVRKRSPR